MGDGVVILWEAGGRLGFPESLVARRTRMEGRSSGQPTRPSSGFHRIIQIQWHLESIERCRGNFVFRSGQDVYQVLHVTPI